MLSIVIPAYNEETRVPPTVEALARYFKGRGGESEIIVANDGSTDNTSLALHPYQNKGLVKLVELEHGGKGAALIAGVMASKGDPIFFVDADLPYDLAAFDKALEAFEDPAVDIIIGARNLPGARYHDEYPWYRHLAGKIFSLLVQSLVFKGIPDTQCGFKGFRREAARKLFPKLTIKGYAFDVELLFLAKKHGYFIKRIPVHLRYFDGSKVNVLGDSVRMFLDLLVIRWNDFTGRYRVGGN